MKISDKEFEQIVAEAIDNTPPAYRDKLENIAFIIEDEPSEEKKQKLGLLEGQTLLGLYEGIPLTGRNGSTKILPDKITIYKLPILKRSQDIEELKENVGHTVWHEIAHYFGLNHERIYKLDEKK